MTTGKHPFIEEWIEAVCTTDLHKLLSLYEQDALLRPTLSTNICNGLAAIKTYFTRFLKKGITKIEYRVEGELYLDHSLILMGHYQFMGKEPTLSAFFTFMVKEEGSRYKILGHHSALLKSHLLMQKEPSESPEPSKPHEP